MKLFSTLKRRMAKRLAGSSLVQNAVLERLESDPKAMAKLGKKPAVFEHILAGAALSEGAVTTPRCSKGSCGRPKCSKNCLQRSRPILKASIAS